MIGNRRVAQGEFDNLSNYGLLFTDGLGPCIAVLFYDEVSQTAYLSHLEQPDSGTVWNAFIDIIPKGQVYKIYTWGGAHESINDEETTELTTQSRRFIKEQLQEIFPDSKLNISWTPKDHTGYISIDLETGDITKESDKNCSDQIDSKTDNRNA
ncbi:MAG: hypothetical protein HEP71_22570 [Roseivirga sp.]|nr:hypothetical protein [Roseivirga sp.]